MLYFAFSIILQEINDNGKISTLNVGKLSKILLKSDLKPNRNISQTNQINTS